jgi:hypothetical protein
MNIYGWHFQDFRNLLGSNNSQVLKKATEILVESATEDYDPSKAKAWIRLLIEKGFTFREDRERPTEPVNGGLLTMRMETETHVSALYAIAKALAGEDAMDLSSESDTWKHPCIMSLYKDLGDCGFTLTEQGLRDLTNWILKLNHGSWRRLSYGLVLLLIV